MDDRNRKEFKGRGRGATLFTCQRNEGPHLLEWIAYHRIVGFDRIVVMSNDCTDGSDDLLDLLAEHGIVEHYRQVLPEGVPAQVHAAREVQNKNLIAPGEWLMWLDADEYLNIHTPSKRVIELIDRIGDADGIVVNWVFFGDGGNAKWPGRHLTEKLTRCSWRFFSSNTRQVKTLFRMSADIAGLYNHLPYLGPDFLKNNRYFVNGAGQPLRKSVYYETLPNGDPITKPVLVPRYRLAQVNHYAVRTRDLFIMRQLRPCPYANARSELRWNDWYFNRYNTNTLRDRSILALADATESGMNGLLGLPGVAAASRRCTAHMLEFVQSASRQKVAREQEPTGRVL